jgi:hypothetical protein
MSTPQGYDFNALYGMADHSVSSPLEPGQYDAVVETAEFGRTKDGTKGQWTIKFRITTGERANYPLTMTLGINPMKNDGTPNAVGLGIMFRQLGAMGVPVPPEQQPFWLQGWTEYNVAEFIKGKPVLLRVITDDSYDGSPRSKVKDIGLPRPGAPLQVQQAPQQPGQANPYQQQAQAAFGYGQPQQPPMGGPGGGYPAPGPTQGGPGYPQQVPPNGYPQQPPQQPGYGYPGQQQAPQGPVAPGPWQNAQPPQTGPQQAQGAPGWTQPGQPGQGGMGEFAPQGPPQGQPNGYPQQGQPPQGYGAPAQGAPVPGVQFQPGAPSPSYGQPPQGYQGQPPQDPNQAQQQPPQNQPPLPPWAQ